MSKTVVAKAATKPMPTSYVDTSAGIVESLSAARQATVRILEQMRRFFLTWQIPQTLSAEFKKNDSCEEKYESADSVEKPRPVDCGHKIR